MLDRGACISSGNFAKLKEKNDIIFEHLTEKKDEIRTPVSCFITFETQEGLERALDYFNVDKAERLEI